MMSARASADSSPAVPGEKHGASIASPGHLDWRARVEDHDSSRVRPDHGLDQLALAPGERKVRTVPPFRLPLAVGSDHDNCNVGSARGSDGSLELVWGVGTAGGDAHAHQGVDCERGQMSTCSA